MKKLLIALFGIFCMVEANAQECSSPSYETDSFFTAQASWAVGERIDEIECLPGVLCYRVFCGAISDGRRLIQLFYINGNKFTDTIAVMSDNEDNLVVDGKLTMWHENGQKYSGSYKLQGVQSGLAVSWYENGQKWSEGYYLNGSQIGVWRYWDPNGNLIEEQEYEVPQN